VELHWACAPPYWAIALDVECFERRLESVLLADQEIPNLSTHDTLLVLCIHGAKHLWTRLRWICDIAEIIRRDQRIVWHELLNKATALGCRRLLFLGLSLAKDLLQAPVPDWVSREIDNDLVVSSLAAQVNGDLFPGSSRVSEEFNERIFFLHTRERLRDRMRYLHHDHLRGYVKALPNLLIPSDEDRALLPLPDSLNFVRYVVRPFRLAAVHGARIPVLISKYIFVR
jgi:hypothetical protein